MSPIPERYFLQPYVYRWALSGDLTKALEAVNKIMTESGFMATTEEFLCSREYRPGVSINNGKLHLTLRIVTTPEHISSLDTKDKENNIIEVGKIKNALKGYVTGYA